MIRPIKRNKLIHCFLFFVICFSLQAQKDENLLYTLKKHDGSVTGLSFSDDGTQLASGGEDKLIILWDLNSGEPVTLLPDNYYPIKNLQLLSDQTILATSGTDVKHIDKQGKIN
ncbi:MAG: hypothetical protein HC906_03095 [Bacteroidales bacterium]|nr:hypothetical protein [Bacteroidales bacterium]